MLEDFARVIEGTGHVAVLADVKGRIIYSVGHKEVKKALEDLNFQPGGVWSEEVVGPNGVGTPIALGMPGFVFGPEHFCEGWQPWVCYFLRYPLLGYNTVFGFGLGVPFGLVWKSSPTKAPHRFSGWNFGLVDIALTPTIATEITSRFSIGAGLNIIMARNSHAFIKLGDKFVGQFLSALATPLIGEEAAAPLAELTANGRDDGGVIVKQDEDLPIGTRPYDFDIDFDSFSFNVGALYRVNDRLTVGLTYRHKTEITHTGIIGIDFDHSTKAAVDPVLGSLVPGLVLPLSVRSPFSVKLDIPRQIDGGIAYRVSPSTLVSFSFLWTHWSNTDGWGNAISVKIKNPFLDLRPAGLPFPGIRSLTGPTEFDDTWGFRWGISHALSDSLTLMAGYYFDPTPIRNKNYLNLTIGNNRHYLSFGAQWRITKSLVLSLGTQLILFEHRTIKEGESVNGGGLVAYRDADGDLTTADFVPNTRTNFAGNRNVGDGSGKLTFGGFFNTYSLELTYYFGWPAAER